MEDKPEAGGAVPGLNLPGGGDTGTRQPMGDADEGEHVVHEYVVPETLGTPVCGGAPGVSAFDRDV
jgi:hypothetical protein